MRLLLRKPLPPVLAAMALTALSAGCGGAAFDGGIYKGDGFAFRVPETPGGWRRLDLDGAALAFEARAEGAIVALNGRCGEEGEDVPLRSLTQHLFMQFTERVILEQSVVPFDGREAMHTVMVAKLDGVPRKFDIWVMRKDGCVYDLLYLAPPENFERGKETFRAYVSGFRALPREGDS